MKTYKLDVQGKILEARFTDIANQANGSVIMRAGDTMVMVTAVMGNQDRDLDYFPLTVEYEEKYYAAGKIYGSRFVRRESRPSEYAILSGRAIDRSIRPRFDQRARRDTQVVATVLSVDAENDPVVLCIIGASLALLTSNIPWNGPIAAVRVNTKNGENIYNADATERSGAELDLLISGAEERINMIECGANQIAENSVLEKIQTAKEIIKKICVWQQKIAEEQGKTKTEITYSELPAEKIETVKTKISKDLEEAIYTPSKNKYKSNLSLVREKMLEELTSEGWTSGDLKRAVKIYEDLIDEIVHKNILEKNKRPDGRALDELRELEAMTGFLPRTHGSAIFKRGDTHALSVITLGAPSDVLTIQGMEITGEKRFIHHYNFPPYSVGETGAFRGPGRREIGHGALAEKSLLPIIPSEEDFPYTIRVVSEILSSNGSSSMASVCSSILALMDAGVPIKTPAAGIAMGLMTDAAGKYKVLTDIQGPEDHHGDMDLKIAGTKNGVTGIQMDVKIEGVTLEILEKVLEQAKKARLEIIEVMTEAINEPRKELSMYAPRIIRFAINPDKIREVIGPGGKVINEIIAKTGVTIDLEDDGRVFITAQNEEAAGKALDWIKNITKEFKVGEMMNAKVKRIADFGAFVELTPGQDALLHVSEISSRRVERVSDVLKIGDIIPVKIIRIDDEGKIAVSAKAAS